MPVWLVGIAVIAVLGLVGVVARFLVYGDVDPNHVLLSFFVAKRHRRLRPWEAFAHVHWANSLWILLPLLGMYVSVRLILDGDYSVLGHG